MLLDFKPHFLPLGSASVAVKGEELLRTSNGAWVKREEKELTKTILALS
jgi:hypothetical protein